MFTSMLAAALPSMAQAADVQPPSGPVVLPDHLRVPLTSDSWESASSRCFGTGYTYDKGEEFEDFFGWSKAPRFRDVASAATIIDEMMNGILSLNQKRGLKLSAIFIQSGFVNMRFSRRLTEHDRADLERIIDICDQRLLVLDDPAAKKVIETLRSA